MPAFPMSKQVTHDRVVLVREPREEGSAFAQFERALAGYLERHPVYRDRERVVYRDRPCPVCTPVDEWGDPIEDDDDDERDGPQPCPVCKGSRLDVAMDGTIIDCPRCVKTESPLAPPPTVRARLRAALEARLTDAAIEDAARMLATPFRNGDVEVVRFVLGEVLGGGD